MQKKYTEKLQFNFRILTHIQLKSVMSRFVSIITDLLPYQYQYCYDILQPPPREDTTKIDAMTKQMESMKEQLKSKDRELGNMEDELDNKNAEINNSSELKLAIIS